MSESDFMLVPEYHILIQCPVYQLKHLQSQEHCICGYAQFINNVASLYEVMMSSYQSLHYQNTSPLLIMYAANYLTSTYYVQPVLSPH